MASDWVNNYLFCPQSTSGYLNYKYSNIQIIYMRNESSIVDKKDQLKCCNLFDMIT